MQTHEDFMNRCFELAQMGKGRVGANPMVGAVLVHNDQILSEGYHAYYGGPHAEVICLDKIENRVLLAESTLYISLEPCNFFGKTPPCTELILKSGVPKVVIGSVDFNPKVRNLGIDYLRSQEIEVINLNWEERQKALNIRFFINQSQNQPYFVGKLALSNDNFIGEIGKKTKITSLEIDALGHKLRAEVDAIIVGNKTWNNDKPSLTTRYYYSENQPDIIILRNGGDETQKSNDGRHVHFISSTSADDLKQKIYELGYKNVLVEGGAEVFRYFMNNSLFHEVHTFQNQELELKSGVLAPAVDLRKYHIIDQKNYFNHQLNHYFRNDLPHS